MPVETPRPSEPVQVHVAWASTAPLAGRFPEDGPYDLSGSLQCLDGEERERLGRFRFAVDARAYAAAHALLRHELERVGGAPAASFELEASPGGRPELAASGPHGRDRLRFSLSHSRGAVACAIALGGAPVGVDIERVHGKDVVADVAARVLSAREQASLLGLDDDDACRRFFARWTLKEAYAKALGVGLSMPFERIEWSVDGRLQAALQAAPDATGAPTRSTGDWGHDLTSLAPAGAGEHLLAACLHGPDAVEWTRFHVVERALS